MMISKKPIPSPVKTPALTPKSRASPRKEEYLEKKKNKSQL